MKENKCSYCKKELLPKDLISFWDDKGDWHYCGGEWRRNHRSFWRWRWNRYHRRDCCRDFSNHPLFLCRPCYNSYQERKKQTIQQHKEIPRNLIIVAIPILTCGLIFVLSYLIYLIKRVQKKTRKQR